MLFLIRKMAGTRGSQSTYPRDDANHAGVLRLEVGPQTIVIVRGEVPAVNEPLTQAEIEVARAVQAGLSTREVAALRTTSIRTVETQLSTIYRKLGIGCRRELLMHAALEKSAPPEG